MNDNEEDDFDEQEIGITGDIFSGGPEVLFQRNHLMKEQTMIYQSVNPEAIVTCHCGHSGKAREFGATGKVEDRHEKCHCPKCHSILLEIEP